MPVDKRFSIKFCFKKSKDLKELDEEMPSISESSSSLLGFKELFDDDYEKTLTNTKNL